MTTEHGFSLKSGFTKISCTPHFPLLAFQSRHFILKCFFVLFFAGSTEILQDLPVKCLLHELGANKIRFYCQKQRGWNTCSGACSYLDAGDRWQVTGDRWQVTGDWWHKICYTLHVTHDTLLMTWEMWHVTHDMWHMIWQVIDFFYIIILNFLYWCYHPNTLRDLVSSVCMIFLTSAENRSFVNIFL